MEGVGGPRGGPSNYRIFPRSSTSRMASPPRSANSCNGPASRLIKWGQAQAWPATPVAEPLVELGQARVVYRPRICSAVRAELTVVGARFDSVGGVASGRNLRHARRPPPRRAGCGHEDGDLTFLQTCTFEEGTVLHTIGYPEGEIFGFLYVHPGCVASVGIFVLVRGSIPRCARSSAIPQHFITHPALWKHLQGGRLRSLGRQEPAGNRGARRAKKTWKRRRRARRRLGLDRKCVPGRAFTEAWLTGYLLAEAVHELWRQGLPLTKPNFEARYGRRRRARQNLY